MADHGRLYAVNKEMQNNLITDAKANGDDDECDQTHLSPMRFSPSRQFTASLKSINDEYTYGHDKKQETGPVVVGFDSDRFIKYCDRASPDYDSKFANFDEIAGELFQTGEVWVSHDLLFEAMELLFKYHGFTICIEKEILMCNRKGEHKTSRAYVNGALKADCTFHFKLALLETEKYLPPNSTVKKSRYKKMWDRPPQILSGCAEHGELCTPNRSNRITTCQQQGKYVDHIQSSDIFSLCNSLENFGGLDLNLVVNSLRHVWPWLKAISKHSVFNIHSKIMKLLSVLDESKRDYEHFKAVVNATDMLSRIDNEVFLDDDRDKLLTL